MADIIWEMIRSRGRRNAELADRNIGKLETVLHSFVPLARVKLVYIWFDRKSQYKVEGVAVCRAPVKIKIRHETSQGTDLS